MFSFAIEMVFEESGDMNAKEHRIDKYEEED
jgi:hypothetical protein